MATTWLLLSLPCCFPTLFSRLIDRPKWYIASQGNSNLPLHLREAYRHTLVYVWSTTLLIISTIVLLTRRALVAVLLVTAVVALIRVVAVEKHRKMNMTLHAYDIAFYLSSWPTISFLWSHFRLHFITFVTAVSTILAATVLIFYLDPTRVWRRYSLCVVLLFGFVAYSSAPARIEAHY